VKRFKKFFRYFGVFVLLAVAVAGFKVANFLLGQKPQEELSEPSGKEESSALTEILNKILSMETGEFDLTIGIDSNGEEMSLQAKALVDMGKTQTKTNEQKAFSVGGMKVALDGNFALNGQEIDYKIAYLEDYIFANLSGFDVKMFTSNLEQDISTLLSLSMFERFGVDVELPELSMDNFDNSLLVKLTSSIKEEKAEGEIKVSLNLFGYGDVVVLTDEEYNPKQIIIEELDFEGTKISCHIDAKINEDIAPIAKPANADQMLDLTNLTHIASSVSDLLDKGYVSGNVDLNVYGEQVSANYEIGFADFKNPTFYMDTTIAGQNLVLSYENKKMFVSYDGLKYFLEIGKFDLAEMLEKVESLSLAFGYELPKIELPQGFELSQITGVLSLVDNFVLEKDYISLSLLGATIDVEIVDGEFDNFKFAYGENLAAKINLNEEIEKEDVDKTQYFSIDNLENKLASIISQIKEKKFAANVMLCVNNCEFETTIFVDFAKELKLRVCGEVEKVCYDIAYIDEYVFVNINGLKLKYELPDLNIDSALEEVEKILAQYLPEFELPSFEEMALENMIENVEIASLLAFVNDIDFKIVSANAEFVEIAVEGVNIKVYGENLIEDISVEYKDFAFSAEMLDNNFDIATTNDYIRINEALDYIPAIVDFASAGKYQITTQVELGEIVANIVGKIDITSGLKAQFEIMIEGYEILVSYIDGKCFVDFADKTIECSEEELAKIVGKLLEENNFAFDTQLDLSNLDVLKSIVQNGNVLEVALNAGLTVCLEKENGKLTGLGLVYENFDLAVELANFEGEITRTNLDVIFFEDIVDFIEKANNFYQNGKAEGKIILSVCEEVFEVEYVVDFANDVQAYFKTEILGQNLIVEYVDKKVYVAYDGYKYFVELENFDISSILEKVAVLANKFDVELPSLNFENVEIEKEDLLSMLLLVEDFGLTADKMTLAFAGATISVEANDETISKVVATYNDFTVEISVCEDVEKIETNKEEYIAIEKLEEKINTILNQLKAKKFGAHLTVAVDEMEFATTVYVDFNGSLKARLTGEVEGFKYDIVYRDNFVFANINELKIKYELPELDFNGLIGEFEKVLGQYVPGIDFASGEIDVVEMLSLVDFAEIMAFSKQLDLSIVKANQNEICVEFEGFLISLELSNDTIAKIEISQGTSAVTVDVLANDFEIEPVGKHVQINVALEYIPAILDFVKTKKYQIATTISLGEIEADVSGKIDITNGLKAQFEVGVDKFVFEITYIDEVVYINFSNKTFKATIKELEEFIARFEKDEEVEENDNSNFDILEDILGDENVLEIALKAGFSVILEKEGNSLTGLGFVYEDLSLAFELSTFDGEISYTQNEQVLSIVELYDFADVLVNFVTNKTLAFDIDITFGELVLTGKAMLKDDVVQAYLETEIMDRTLLVVLKNNRIYLDFDGLKITCAIDQIGELVAYVCEYAGLEMPEIELPQEIDIDKLISDIVLKLENEILSISYEDLIVDIDTTEAKLNSISVGYADLSLTLVPCEEFDKATEGEYIDLYELKELSRAVYNTLKNMSVSGTIEVTLNLFGEDNLLSIDYAIALKDNKVIGFVETEFKGLAINAYIDGEDLYLNVVDLKIHLNLNDINSLIDWINETFEANINTEEMNNLLDELMEMKLDFISSVKTVDNVTYVEFKTGTKVQVEYDEYVNAVRFEQDGREAILTCTDFSLINLNNLQRGEYKDWSEFTALIEYVYSLAMSTQFDLTGEAKVYNKDALSMDISGNVQLDITNGLLAYANIDGLGEQITITYQDKKLYFRYAGVDGLKISIGEEAIQEIASILLSAMGVDTSSIPFLDDFLTKEDIDTDNLGSLMPEIDFGNPLDYLEYIHSFEVTDEYFAVNIKGEKISSYAEGKDVSIKIFYANGKVTKLAVSNLYISEDERFDLTINLNDFADVTKVTEEDKANYIDLTNSKDLIKAFVNTSSLNDYHINGKVKLNVDIGVEFPMASLNVDARIKREEIERTYVDEKTGEVIYEKTNEILGIITIDNYPLIGLVNGENTNGVGGTGLLINIRARKITIILKGAYAYLFTDDEDWGAYDRLQRATKVTTSYLLGHLEYYMQYLLGFTDTIQTKINETIEASRNYTGPVKYGDIIKEYTLSGRKHTIVLNMAEIAHNGDIGNLTVNLTTLNNDSTGNKDFLYRLDITMELFGGMLSIATNQESQTDALFLVDIGKTVDLSTCNKMISDYDFTYGLGVDGEYEKQGNGGWKQANTGSSTVTFMNLGEVYAETSGAIASPMTLPTLTRVEYETRADGKYKVEYKFLGWFSDEKCTQKFESAYFPRYNTTLFAGWEVSAEKKEVTVSFVTGEESKTEAPLVGYATEKLTLPTAYSSIETKVNENVSILKTFLGWFDENGVEHTNATFNKFPSADMTLYGKWLVEETSTYNLTIEYDGNIYNTTVPGDREYDFAIVKDVYTAGTSKVYDFETGKEVTDFVVNGNYHWVIKNPFVATVRSYFNTNGNVDSSKTYELKIGDNPLVYNGDQIELAVQSNYSNDMGTYIIEYTFNGYKAIRLDTDGEDSSLGELIAPNANGKIVTTMPSRNVVYVADWTAKEYVNITFDTTWAKPADWIDKNDTFRGKVERLSAPTPIATIKVQRNVAFDPSKYNSTCKYKYTCVFVPGTYNFFVGTWKTEGGNSCAFTTTPVDASNYSVLTSVTPSEHMTLYAHWDA